MGLDMAVLGGDKRRLRSRLWATGVLGLALKISSGVSHGTCCGCCLLRMLKST